MPDRKDRIMTEIIDNETGKQVYYALTFGLGYCLTAGVMIKNEKDAGAKIGYWNGAFIGTVSCIGGAAMTQIFPYLVLGGVVAAPIYIAGKLM